MKTMIIVLEVYVDYYGMNVSAQAGTQMNQKNVSLQRAGGKWESRFNRY